MRKLAVVMASICALSLLVACGKSERPDRELRAALARTARLPHRYVYDDTSGDRKTVVQGLVEDDFRYKAEVVVDGAVALDEVTSDDAVADRLIDASKISVFQAQGAVATPAGRSTGLTPGQSLEALRAGQWVRDPTGAPSLTVGRDSKRKMGDDPIVDSLTVWQYVDLAITGAFRVVKFNKESIEYKAKEDPFPPPEKGSGVTRYDLLAPFLPRQSGAANQAVPDISNFRKLSVYVKDGLVIQVLETIDVISRLNDIKRNYGVKFPASNTDQENADFAIRAINEVRVGQGNSPIRPRDMSFAVRDTGKPTSVALPTEGVTGDLAALTGRGKAARVAAGQPASSTQATTPPAPPPSP